MARPTLFVPPLEAQERTRIEEALKKARDPRYRDRLRAVLWSGEQLSISQIAHLLGKHPTTVLRWLRDYLRFGAAGLTVGKSPGRPRLVGGDGEACLREALSHNPRELGYRFTRWTLATLAEHLYRELHIRITPSGLSRTLHRLAYSYKRPKLSLKHRQDAQAVRQARRQRDAALKKPEITPTGTSSSFRTSASSTSTPA